MSRIELIRRLQTFTPMTDYKSILTKEFGVQVPDAAPLYQQEFLAKYCLQLQLNGVPAEIVVEQAATKVNEFMSKFPWTKLKYEDVIMNEEVRNNKVTRKAKAVYADGTVVHNPKNGMFFFYIGNAIAARGNSLDGLKKTVAKKLGSDVIVNEPSVTL